MADGRWLLVLLITACSKATALEPTLADLKPIHGRVSVTSADREPATASALVRLREDDTIETDAAGRARVRLDDGTTLLVDHQSRVVLRGSRIELESGRLFAQVPEGVKAEFALSEFRALMSDGAASFERTDQARVYVAEGELTAAVDGKKDVEAHSGEVLSVIAGKLEVQPGRAFVDWTEGLMTPWAALDLSRRALGEVWGRSDDELGSALAIRSHDVAVTVRGEVAVTRVTTQYFNGGSTDVIGDFRFALPSEAIVSSFRWGLGGELAETRIALAERKGSVWVADSPRIEWAGEGWLRGRVPAIASGAVFTLEVEYVEWLAPEITPAGTVVRYRYPMVSEAKAPLIGEFSARLDASGSKPFSLAAGMGAKVEGDQVTLRRSDFHPTADLVVEVGLPAFKSPARLYRTRAASGDSGGDYVMVRTAAPPAAAVATGLVVVLDTSRSVERSGGDQARTFVRSMLSSLGAEDQVLLLAADQAVRSIGGDALAPLDPERRNEIHRALDELSFGGATDLGRALEAGVRAIPRQDPRALVVYVGDGWATLGDESLAALQARLARSVGFSPRLGAVAVGNAPNRVLLSALTRGTGPMFEVGDTARAAEVATELVALSMKPAVSSVSVDLGPGVERVYPTRPVTVFAGEPVTFVGRAVGEVPNRVILRFRQGEQLVEQPLGLGAAPVADPGDLRRRWARARVEALVLEQKGRELVTDVALQNGLITPWTALTPQGARYHPLDLSALVLDQAYPPNGGLLPTLHPSEVPASVLKRPTTSFAVAQDEPDVATALGAAIRRKLRDADASVRACRDSRAALLPTVSSSFRIRLRVDGRGLVSSVDVEAQGARDAELERCIRVVVSGLSFPNLGLDLQVEVSDTLSLPPYVLPKHRRCSPESTLLLGARRGFWQEELRRSSDASALLDVYMNAKRDCELKSWREKLTLLTLMLEHHPGWSERLGLMRGLLAEGQKDASAFVRRETLAGARSPEELLAIEAELLGDERLPYAEFRREYDARNSDAERLAVVRKYLLLAPHDERLQTLLLALLGSTAQTELLQEQVRTLREDPFTSVGLLADAARALGRNGQEVEARRAFGELIERAPTDPWVRAFLGDRLRNEGAYDDATATYLVLETMAPGDPRVTLRQALAHAGAGRLDVARRMLSRVAETGGREGDPTLAQLARQLDNVLLARAVADVDGALKSTLEGAALLAPHPMRGTLVLLEAPAAQADLDVVLEDPDGAWRAEAPVLIRDPGMGVYTIERPRQLEAGSALTVRAPERPVPLEPLSVRVEVLTYQEHSPLPSRAVTAFATDPRGTPMRLEWDGEGFRPASRPGVAGRR